MYFDFCATTPVASEVISVIETVLRYHWGNPSSRHTFGNEPKTLINTARHQVARLINARHTDEILFVSCATESINQALKGAAFACKDKGKKIISSTIEHPATIASLNFLKKQGFDVVYLPVDSFGIVHVEDLQKEMTEDTILITCMTANNETGSIQPIKELVEAAKAINPHVLFHTDASQAISKIYVDVTKSDVDMLTIAGHKFYAPKGIGALYVKAGSVNLVPLIHGASQEGGLRAGTENVAFIAGLGEACRLALSRLDWHIDHLFKMRNLLHQLLLQNIEEGLSKRLQHHDPVENVLCRINGPLDYKYRLNNILSIGFRGLNAVKLLHNIRNQVAASAGAACHSSVLTPSSVLEAMHVDRCYSEGTVRLSVGASTTEEEVIRCAKIIADEAMSLWTDDQLVVKEL